MDVVPAEDNSLSAQHKIGERRAFLSNIAIAELQEINASHKKQIEDNAKVQDCKLLVRISVILVSTVVTTMVDKSIVDVIWGITIGSIIAVMPDIIYRLCA